MKTISCINGWINDKCCGSDNQFFIHGIRIKSGKSILGTYAYPFKIQLSLTRLIITKDDIETHYRVSDFEQTYSEIKDLVARCGIGSYGNQLKRKSISYIVNAGDQNIFSCPIEGIESHILDSDYYDVYINGQLRITGLGEFQFMVDEDGNVEFAVAIVDLTPDEDANIVDIFYWVRE